MQKRSSLLLLKFSAFTLIIASFFFLWAVPHQVHVFAYEGSLPAFPGAEGWGAQSVGGRGGQVIEVTNLNDSGSGSLRAAVEVSGPRVVVFRVAGTIVLNSRLNIINPYITIAGQTAPGEGITLRMNPSICYDKGTMLIETHNVIIRYLRLRPGTNTCADDTHDALTIYKQGAHDIIIDHVSMSWAVDEVLNTYDYSYNITIQNSIISEGLSHAAHPEGEHSKGALIGGVEAKQITLHHNLFVSNKDRNPQVSGVNLADVRNNVIYNYGTGSGSGVTLISSSKGFPRVNWVGNYYKPGPSSDLTRSEFALYEGTTGKTWLYYAEGNKRWTTSGNQPARLHSSATGYNVTTPFTVPFVTTTSADQAYVDVLVNAGASINRDSVDERLIANVKNGTGRIIDNESQVGGYPTLLTDIPPIDSDHDGMADNWEEAQFGNLNHTASSDFDNDGYTNIEEYINGLIPENNTTSTPTSTPTQYIPAPTLHPTLLPTPTLQPTPTPTITPPSPIPQINIIPIADTYVKSSSLNSNYGKRSSVEIDGSPTEIAYMKFDLRPLAGNTITSAKLRIYISNSSYHSQSIKSVADNSWTETGMTYRNRPSLENKIVSLNGGKSGKWKEIDITSFVKSQIGQVFSIAIDSTQSDGLGFSSRETSKKPTLIITSSSLFYFSKFHPVKRLIPIF